MQVFRENPRSVREILRETREKRGFPREIPQKSRIHQEILELSAVRLEIIKKRALFCDFSAKLSRHERANTRKTLFFEEKYSEFSKESAQKQDFLDNLLQKIAEYPAKLAEKQTVFAETKKKLQFLQELWRSAAENGAVSQENREIREHLAVIRQENRELSQKIDKFEEIIAETLSFSRKAQTSAIIIKEKEARVAENAFLQLKSSFFQREDAISAEKREKARVLQEIQREIERVSAEKAGFLEENAKISRNYCEKTAFLQETLRKSPAETSENREKLLKDRGSALLQEISCKKRDFEHLLQKLLQELETKSGIIKENTEKLAFLNKKFDKLELFLKENRENHAKSLVFLKKKRDKKLEKHKILKNLLHNAGKNCKNANFCSREVRQALLVKSALQKDFEKTARFLHEFEEIASVFKENRDELLAFALELRNSENELQESSRTLREKQEILRKSKEIQEKCREQVKELL